MRQLALIVSTLVTTASNLLGQDTTATLEPDHIYIWVSRDAPEAAVLRDLGINQYPDTMAPGEGVNWIAFAFENIFIELLWVVDEELFREKWVSWDSLHYSRANWRSTGASPFGLAFHRVGPDTLPLPFETVDWWDPSGGWVEHSDRLMPFLFVTGPRYAMPDPWWMTPEVRALAANPAGIGRLTDVTLGTPRPVTHEVLQVLAEQGILHSRVAGEHILKLTFDNGRQGKTYDARPTLPLVIRY